MADPKTQAEWNAYYAKPENTPNWAKSLGASALDAATFYQGPRLRAMVTGEDADQLSRQFEAYQAANPKADAVGGVLGFGTSLIPAGLAAKGAVLGARGVGALARYLYPAAATTGKALMSAGKATAIPAAIASGAGYFSGRESEPAAPAATPGDMAAVERARANNAESTRIADERRAVPEFLANLGLSVDQGKAIQQKYGGIPLYAIKALAEARPTPGKPPGYKDVAFDGFMQLQNARLAQMAKAGATPEQLSAERDKFAGMLADILGADLGSMIVPQE